MKQFIIFKTKKNSAVTPDFRNLWKQGQKIAPGATFPSLCEKCMGSLTSLVNQYREDEGDWVYDLLSVSGKTTRSNICIFHDKGSTFSSAIL